jgi:hypothetical protein
VVGEEEGKARSEDLVKNEEVFMRGWEMVVDLHISIMVQFMAFLFFHP